MLTIAADKKRLGARIAITSALHTWGSAMMHHPHVHMIVPGGGLSADGKRWIAAKPRFLLPVRVLSKLFRRLMLEKLAASHKRGKLAFFAEHAPLADPKAFAQFLKPLKRTRWFVYAKRPFAGPKAVLAYLSRYTHRVAISNARLITADADNVTFKVKDYRVEGPARYTTMTLRPAEFIRRFLGHVLPKGFHRIRHYGLLAAATKAETIATVRDLLSVTSSEPDHEGEEAHGEPTIVGDCPCCGGRMHIIETFEPGCRPRHPPSADQDRYLMSPRTVSRIRSTVIQPCWSIARCGAAHAPIAIPLSRQPISLLPALRHVSAQPSPALAHSQDAVRLTKTAQRYPNKKRKIPIAVAARTLAYLSRVLSLEAFGHRPRAWLNRCHWPVSETLHTNGTTTS